MLPLNRARRGRTLRLSLILLTLLPFACGLAAAWIGGPTLGLPRTLLADPRVQLGALVLVSGLLASLSLLGWVAWPQLRRLQSERRDLARLNAVFAVLVRETDFDRVSTRAIATIVEAFDLATGAFALYEEETHSLRVVALEGFPEHLKPERCAIGPEAPWLSGQAAHWRRTVASSAIAPMPGREALNAMSAARGIREVVAVPVLVGDRLLAVMTLSRRTPFRPEERDALALAAQQVAFALENARSLRALAALDRLKSDFIATVSHELRTPITAIKGAGALLTGLSPAQGRFVEMICTNAERLARVVNDLLDFGRLEAGGMRYRLAPCDLAAMLVPVVDVTRAHAADCGVVFTAALEPGLPSVRADAVQLTRVVAGLLDNAMKFTPAGGRVRLEVRRTADTVELRVSDTGSGIAPAAQAQIFRPFHQIDSSLTRRRGGAGLGLALARAIVEAHGSALQIESALGVGTSLSFRLDAVPDEALAGGPEVAEAV